MRASAFTYSTIIVALGSVTAQGQATRRISELPDGADANGTSYGASVSADGRYVAFESAATNLVLGDSNGVPDVFVFDRATATLTLVSATAAGTPANGASVSPTISSDGSRVVFVSDATDLVSGSVAADTVYVRDLVQGTTVVASIDAAGVPIGDCWTATISGDGHIVAYGSWAATIVAGDHNQKSDIFVHDLATHETTRVSVDSSGVEGDLDSFLGSLSLDGRLVVFESSARNLVAGDLNFERDVFIHDRATSTTSMVSVDAGGVQGNSESTTPDISDDGTVVTFATQASTLGANGWQVLLKSLVDESLTVVSVDDAGAPMGSSVASVSADGRFVVFESSDPITSRNGIFIRDRAAARTFSVDVADDWSDGNAWSGLISYPSCSTVSADGRVVVFYSLASNLSPSDQNGTWDIFARERVVESASWSNYGSGFPGKNGVPSFTCRSNPVLGTTITADVGNSSGAITVAVVLVGNDSIDVPTNKGGHLLVDALQSFVIVLWQNGSPIDALIPLDEATCGLSFYAQALQLDPFASKGMSFTQGVELVLGY